MRLTLVSKLVRTFDHVGLSQSNNREQKQTQIKQIHDISLRKIENECTKRPEEEKNNENIHT